MAERGKGGVRSPHPVDPHRVIERLVLSAGKAAELCGISRRQLCYWTDKGIIQAVGDDSAQAPPSRRCYGAAALCRAIMIRREMEQGNSLHRAVALVDKQLRAQESQERDLADAPGPQRDQLLLAQADRLAAIAGRLRQVAQAGPGGPTLRALAQALRLVPEEAEGDDIVGELLAEPEACRRLVAAVDRAEALIESLPAAP